VPNVKKAQLLAVLAASALLLCLPGSDASAQQQPVRQPGHPGAGGNIALLDVSYIFEKLPRFKQMMDEMKADVDRAEQNVKTERDAIKKLADRLEGFKGTADYKAMEEELAKRMGDLNVQISLQKKDFLLREARIYHNVYKEIQQEVEYYCAANGIDVVLRFSGDPVDVEKPDSVLAFINRPVVTYAKDRDITPIILDHLVKRSTAPNAVPSPADNRGLPGGVPSVPFQRR
jgi:Skp family chaperone for outer membrane proteins